MKLESSGSVIQTQHRQPGMHLGKAAAGHSSSGFKLCGALLAPSVSSASVFCTALATVGQGQRRQNDQNDRE